MEYLKKLLATDNSYATIILRVFVAIAMFPHGAQKLFGLYGGYGFSATMGFFTNGMGIPAPLAFLAIMAESVGAIFIALGLLTRVSAFGMLVTMTVAAGVHFSNGLFINWANTPNVGHGIEFHLLVIAISLALVITGGGALSADSIINKKLK